MPKGTKKRFKNIAMLTVRNKTKQEVTNVVFPNGITIGVDDNNFLNGAKIFGNVVVSGSLSAGEIMKNGVPISTTTSTSAAPFLFLDLNSNVFAFDNSADTSATPPTIVLSAQQVSQSSTFKGPIFSLSGSTGTNLTSSLGSDVLTETGTGTATRTVVVTYNNTSMRSVFPLTASVSYDGLTSTKLISKVQGGTDGDDGDDGPRGLDGTATTTLNLDLNAGIFAFTGSDDVTATPPNIVMTSQQVSQSSTLVTGDFSLTGYDGTNLSSHLTSFNVSSTGTGTSTATKIITYDNSAMRSKFPLTASVSNDGLTSTKIISSVQGADPTVTAAFTTSVVSVETDASGAALDDAGDLSDADISDQAFTKLDVDAGSQNIAFAGHNESGNPAVNTYKLVSDDITAITDNGTSLTEANSASEGDGVSGTYNITFANSGTRLTLTVSTDSGDAKLKVASLAKDEDGSSTAFTSIVVNIPIKVTTSGGTKTITRSFTVVKNKKGTTGSTGSSGNIVVPITMTANSTNRSNGHKFSHDGPTSPSSSGILKTSFEIGDGHDSNGTYDNSLNTSYSQAEYNSACFARVPAGGWTIKRISGTFTLSNHVSLDIVMSTRLFKTDNNDAGGSNQNFTEVTNVQMDGGATFNARADGATAVDTGAITASIAEGHGLALMFHISTINVGGTSDFTWDLLLEYST